MLGKYFMNILVAFDFLGNAFLAGDPDETISSRAGKARRAGRKWGCILCGFLDKIDKGHCEKYLVETEGEDGVLKDSPAPSVGSSGLQSPRQD